MPQVRIGIYEGFFLLAPAATADLAAAVEHVKGILTRAEAEILVLRKWDERKLAYPIMGQKRGTYLLAYFKARATQIANIDRDCNLSEIVTRSLITAADHMGAVELELAKKEIPAAVEARLHATATPGAAAPGATPAPPGSDAVPAAGAETAAVATIAVAAPAAAPEIQA